MNQTFEGGRFWQLVRWHWTENKKGYLLAFLAIPGMLLGWFGFNLMIGGYHPLNENMQIISYDFGLYLIGCWYASTLFGDLSSQPRGIFYLSIPASHLEKLLCAILFGVVLLLFFYTLAFYLTDIPMLKIANSLGYERFRKDHLVTDPYTANSLFRLQGDLTSNSQGFLFVFISYFPVQSAFLLGSVYFTRYAFIKSTLAIVVLWWILFVVLFKICGSLMPDQWRLANLDSWQGFDRDGQTQMVRLAPWLHEIVSDLVKFGITILLWIITYIRLKEKEI